MRALFAALLLLTAGMTFRATPAQADPYAWCALFYGDLSGVQSCYFNTLEQCRASLPGMGGTCQPNAYYTGSAKRPAARRAKPRS